MGFTVFGFGKGSLDFLKEIRKRDASILLVFIVFCLFSAKIYLDNKEQSLIKLKIQQDSIANYKKIRKDSISVVNKTIAKLKMMSEQRVIKSKVNHELSKICRRWGADYSAINLFSNGDSTFNGFHFEKMSREFEGRAKNKIPLLHNVKSWSTDPFAEEVNYLEEHQVIYYADVEKDASIYIKKVLNYYKVKSIIYVAYMEHNYISGYMSIEFGKVTNFKDNERNAMMRELHNIKLLIEKYKHNKAKLKR